MVTRPGRCAAQPSASRFDDRGQKGPPRRDKAEVRARISLLALRAISRIGGIYRRAGSVAPRRSTRDHQRLAGSQLVELRFPAAGSGAVKYANFVATGLRTHGHVASRQEIRAFEPTAGLGTDLEPA